MAHSYDNTLLQRMGFSDPDRRTPAHDDACVEIATDPERFIRAVKELRFLRNGRCELEVPLQKGEGKYASTVGFIDAIVTYETAREDYSINQALDYCSENLDHTTCVKNRETHQQAIDAYNNGERPYQEQERELSAYECKTFNTTSEESNKRVRERNAERNIEHLQYHIAGRDKHTSCEPPIPVSGPASLSWWTRAVLVEVKTRITRIGDLLRQMNLYREYKTAHGRDPRNGRPLTISEYIIWSLDPADSRFTKLLAQQGYTLITGSLP
jgi:hypothetical protein